MSGMKRKGLALLVLCALVAVGMAASHLALTDIHHGVEPNLEAEWWVVRVSFVLNAALVVAAGFLARHLIWPFRSRPQAAGRRVNFPPNGDARAK